MSERNCYIVTLNCLILKETTLSPHDQFWTSLDKTSAQRNDNIYIVTIDENILLMRDTYVTNFSKKLISLNVHNIISASEYGFKANSSSYAIGDATYYNKLKITNLLISRKRLLICIQHYHIKSILHVVYHKDQF